MCIRDSRETDPPQRPQGGRIGRGRSLAAQAEADILAHRKMRKQGIVLEDEADAAMLGLDETIGVGDVSPFQQDATCLLYTSRCV